MDVGTESQSKNGTDGDLFVLFQNVCFIASKQFMNVTWWTKIDWLFQIFTFQVLPLGGRKEDYRVPHLRCDVIADAAAAGIRWIHPPPRIEADDLTNISFWPQDDSKKFFVGS